MLEIAKRTKLDTLLVPNKLEFPDEAVWLRELVEVTVEVVEVLLRATAAKVSKRLTALASLTLKLGSETLMLDEGEFLFSLEFSDIGTSEVGGGGGGGNAGGGVTFKLKSSEVEKSNSLDNPLFLDAESLEALEVPLNNFFIAALGFRLRFVSSSPKFMVCTKWARLEAKETTSEVSVVSVPAKQKSIFKTLFSFNFK